MDEPVYRLAASDDVNVLVKLRAAFLAEVSGASSSDPTLLAALTSYFHRALPSDEFVGYLAQMDDQIVATSGLVYHRHPPSPANIQGCEAYVMNVYTLPTWRGRGIATALLRLIIDHARQNNCCRATLHALPQARSIYGKAGFEAIDSEMRLHFRQTP
jgi:GNAT superfamily N-acetyltransferase